MVVWVKSLQAGRKAFQTAILSRSFTILQRTMSEHMERTAHNFRQPGVSEAVVTSIQDVSPTVKHLTLQVDNKDFSFKAGQWVDFVIPSVQTVGGYSMSSAPSRLRIDRSLGLAVKYSNHPPAHWVHKKCKVGDKVGIRVGGDQIIYDPQPSDPKLDLLLLAGGIGINPLVSIVHHVAHLHDKGSCDQGRVEMLYSASSLNELIFKDTIDDICQRISNVQCQYFVTKDKSIGDQSTRSDGIMSHRIDRATLESAIKQLDKSSLRCFICGPPPMIASMETHLQDLGVDKKQLCVEKWW